MFCLIQAIANPRLNFANYIYYFLFTYVRKDLIQILATFQKILQGVVARHLLAETWTNKENNNKLQFKIKRQKVQTLVQTSKLGSKCKFFENWNYYREFPNIHDVKLKIKMSDKMWNWNGQSRKRNRAETMVISTFF